jgi:type II secretory ATPase GspE/PulE/Tfp pilus assembly ATPase PilB-like protein
MNSKVQIKFIDGSEVRGQLGAPFSPAAGRIEVATEAGIATSAFALVDVCYVIFDEAPAADLAATPDGAPVVIETIHGEAFRVRIEASPGEAGGWFAFPVRPEAGYACLFVTPHGLRQLNRQLRIGEILESEGLVEKEEIDRALAEQQRLRRLRVGEIIAERHRIPQEQLDRTLAEAREKRLIPPRMRIGDILVATGLVTRQQVEEALASQEAGKKKRVGELLIERGLITEDQLLSALATRFNLRFVDLDRLDPSEEALAALPYELAARLNVFPVESSGRRLVVATSSPTDPAVGDTLRFYTNRSVELVVARSRQIELAIERHYLRAGGDRIKELLGELKSTVVSVEEEKAESVFTETDSQIINLVNRLLIEAHQKGASDIHFEPGPGKQSLCIRYRIDGICHVAHQIAGPYKAAVIARLKIMSRLDIAERRRPQSGKILIRFENQKLEYRVEITPTVGGLEDAVLRLLSASRPLPLAELGFAPANLPVFREMLGKPYGIILCVGPTGSGKTTTLHSALGHINTPERKIWTAEDPVEITQPGLRQVQVQPKIGFSFPEALRSFLRADPDVIMIGEMRDLETARIAIESSLTGHLVFSTLHTNSAAETIARLIEMGIDPVNFAESLIGVLAQRLTRRLCPQCRRPYHPAPDEYRQLVEAYGERWYGEHGLPAYGEGLRLMQAAGCEGCGNEGYRGRLAVHELLSGTPAMKALLKRKARADEIEALALAEGMRTLRMDGIFKVLRGETDLGQVLRVCL